MPRTNNSAKRGQERHPGKMVLAFKSFSTRLRDWEKQPSTAPVRLAELKYTTGDRNREQAIRFRLKGNNKMKRVLSMTCAALAMAVIAFGADNALGSWKYNAAKSKLPSGVSPITNLTVTREAIDGGAKISAKGERADGSKIDTVTIAKYDGKAVPVTGTGLTWDTAAIKHVDANTLTETRSKQGGKYRSTVRFVVSADGKTMTGTAKGTGADGKPFTSVTVFDKQ